MGRERDKKWSLQHSKLGRLQQEIFYKKLDRMSTTILKLDKAAHQLNDLAFTHTWGCGGTEEALAAGAACAGDIRAFKNADYKKSGRTTNCVCICGMCGGGGAGESGFRHSSWPV